MKIIFFFLCLIFFYPHTAKTQTQEASSIEELFLKQLSHFPQEKIHVQTDKSYYVSGETLWLRAHLVDALLLRQANASRYVYVELIDPLSAVVNRVMLHSDSMGYFHGNIMLDEALPEGNYMLRAYTRFMQNQGEDYFFQKYIHVISPLSADISPEINFNFVNNKIDAEIYYVDKATKKRLTPDDCRLFIDGAEQGEGESLSFEKESAHFTFNSKRAKIQPVFLLRAIYKGRYHSRFFTIPQPDDAFDVSFFPEGGHAPLQTDVRIAFKALKNDGLHENVKGTVYDDAGQEYASFESRHLGMGQFFMRYQPGRTYYAICTNDKNISKRFDLPSPTPGAIALKTFWRNDILQVILTKSPDQPPPSGLHLVAHIRGAVIYSQPWNEKQDYLLFKKDFFPAGIVQLLLIDKERNILSERLVFSSQNSSFTHASITCDKAYYQTREKINLTIQIKDENQAPVTGNFSLSVVDKRDVPMDTTSGIISSLLLTSELKGYIESPMSYLQKDDSEAATALDVLMMTQGWRRYDVQGILKGNLQEKLKYPVESTRQFSGRVTGLFSSLKDGHISLMAVRDSVIGTSIVKLGQDGAFVFKGIDYPDSTRYIVQALTKKGSKSAFIEMDPVDTFPQISYLPSTLAGNRNFTDTHIEKINEKYTIENGMRVINMAEVVVEGQRINRPKTKSPYYSVSSSFVLTTEEIEKANFLTVFDLLRRLPGITVSGNEVLYRQATPLLILDNIPKDNFDYNMLNVNDISDAFVSPATTVMSIFGSRGENGAIVINTKRGFVEKNELNKNMEVFTAIGYQQRVEFYSPAYETEEQKESPVPDLRSTIYWNPAVQTDDLGVADLSFYSADWPSQYGIVLEGVSSFGHLIYSAQEEITIK